MSRVGQRGSWSDRPPGSEGLDSHGLGVLGETTCLHLLAHERVGRLGLNVGRLPVILPVNYVLAGRSIVFRSERGDKLRAAQNGAWACLEVDQFDRFEHSGWSVLATGRMVFRVLAEGGGQNAEPWPENAGWPFCGWGWN